MWRILEKTKVVNASACSNRTLLKAKSNEKRTTDFPQRSHEHLPGSRATVYRQIKAGLLPAPVHIGTRRVAWRLDEIEQHIENLQKVQLVE
ncbi:helix-turn-helix transcriptional regulator [Salmonella enterica]|uniref:helix-turn-helix transcriptional regulator n=1 Tax=Salmonella enterica TaxID=28901 RepID=UPI0020967919|nr:AlpA family phage regulatory protein [Salmonella enterica]